MRLPRGGIAQLTKVKIEESDGDIERFNSDPEIGTRSKPAGWQGAMGKDTLCL